MLRLILTVTIFILTITDASGIRDGSSGESSAMDESLTEQRRVSDDGLRVVKLCDRGRMAGMLIPYQSDGNRIASHV